MYTVPYVRTLSGLTSVTVHLYSLEKATNSILMDVPGSHVSMEVLCVNGENDSYCDCTGSGFTGTRCEP